MRLPEGAGGFESWGKIFFGCFYWIRGASPYLTRYFGSWWLNCPTVSDLFPSQMFSIAYFTGGIAQTNGYLLSHDGTHFVFDAPEGMSDWLKRRNVRVTALFLTHQHFDHVTDAAEIQRDHGCRTFAFAAYSQELTLEKLYAMFTGTVMAIPPFSVDEVLAGKPEIEVEGVNWTLLHIPGHSPDSICFYQPEEGVVLGGDVLFLDGIGRTDFPGGSLQMLLEGIQAKLLTLPDSVKIFPGHGPSTTIGREREQNQMLQEY